MKKPLSRFSTVIAIDPVSASRPRFSKFGTHDTPKYRRFKRDLAFAWRSVNGPASASRIVLKFKLAMPRSWTPKKRQDLAGTAHEQKPDLDNLVKAVLDSLFKGEPKAKNGRGRGVRDDSAVHYLVATKEWSTTGAIEIGCEFSR